MVPLLTLGCSVSCSREPLCGGQIFAAYQVSPAKHLLAGVLPSVQAATFRGVESAWGAAMSCSGAAGLSWDRRSSSRGIVAGVDLAADVQELVSAAADL